MLKLHLPEDCLVVVIVYRTPPHTTPTFNQVFFELMGGLCSSYKRILISGDFNMWAETPFHGEPVQCIF